MTVKFHEERFNKINSTLQNGSMKSVSTLDLRDLARDSQQSPSGISALKRKRVELQKAISVTEHVSESMVHKAAHQLSSFMDRLFHMRSRLRISGKKYRDSWEKLTLPGSVFRVVVLGPGGVGKTSLVRKFVHGSFSSIYVPTVEDMYEKSVTLNKDFNAFFEIMDTSGSYQFPAMRRLTIQNGDAFVLVYSLDRKGSLEEALRTQKEILEIKGTDKTIPMVLVGNKTDLVNEDTRQTNRVEVRKLTRENGLMSSEASAKLGVNVNGIFTALLAQIAVTSERPGVIRKRGRKRLF